MLFLSLVLLSCAPIEPPTAREPAIDSDAVLPEEAPYQLDLGASWRLQEVDDATHTRVGFGEGLAGMVAFDGGSPDSTWMLPIDADGVPGTPGVVFGGVDGFSTPDLLWTGADWVVSARVNAGAELAIGAIDTVRIPIDRGDAAPLTFTSTPRLVGTPDGYGVAWWEGPRFDDSPATYWLAWVDDGGARPPEVVATSAGAGSPVAVAARPDGTWQLVWTERWREDGALSGAVRATWMDGPLPGPSYRLDEGTLSRPPERPSVAIDRDGRTAVGWRAQGEDQLGLGVRLRFFDADGQPESEVLSLGLVPEQANRIVVAVDQGVALAAWDEGGGEDIDVAAQFFDLLTGTALTDPVVVHEARAGRQQRPSVALRATDQVWTARVVFEDGSQIAGQTLTLWR